MKILLSLALVLSSTLTYAFTNAQTPWLSGIIITHERHLLKGELRYDYAHDLLMFRERSDSPLKTFSPYQVASFRYYDDKEDLVHYYKSIVYHPQAHASVAAFFEVVVAGEVSYLRKHNPYPEYDRADKHRLGIKNNPRLNQHVVCYTYFVYLEDEVIRASRFKKEVVPRLIDQGVAVRSHIRKNNLRLYHVGDQIQLIEYTNEQLSSNTSQKQFSSIN